MSAPQVRVGIVSWNTAALLGRCLAALPAALEGLDFSIVVVDNASSDTSVAVARGHPHVRVVVNSENLGYAKAMNQALRGAEADVLVALNPDTEPPPASLAALTLRVLRCPDLGLVAPRLANTDGSLQHSAYTFPSLLQAAVVSFLPRSWQRGPIGRRFWLEGYAPHDSSADIDWVIGAVHVMRSAAVDAEKPYSERYFMYVEDLDLCWRLAQSGWRRRLEADVCVPHIGGAAASQAWAEPARTKWTPLSYDWYAEVHGTAAMRCWAALNTAGIAVRAAACAARGLARQPQQRAQAVELARQLPGHAGAIVRRPAVTPEG